MEKSEFKKITTKVYEEYGFVKKGKYYYLDLEDIIICSGFASMHGVNYLAYNFSLKAVNCDADRKLNNMFDGYDSMEIQMYFNKNADGYQKKEICYEEYNIEEYRNKLLSVLHYYFDPYKKDALTHIRKSYKEIGLVNNNEIIMVKTKARDYLGI